MNLASTTVLVSPLIAHPPLDAVFLFIVLLVIIIDALRSGAARAAALAVAAPLALLLSQLISHAAILGPALAKSSSPSLQTVVFGIIFAVLFFLVYRIIYAYGNAVSQPFAAIVAGFAATAVALVVWLQVPALQSLWHFGPQIQTIFGSPYAFWWLIACFLLLAFARS